MSERSSKPPSPGRRSRSNQVTRPASASKFLLYVPMKSLIETNDTKQNNSQKIDFGSSIFSFHFESPCCVRI
ncbi:hypothetical protein GDI3117 [Gluconacetobacter diazotrophicus PA1 5]|uniref:Uncharacterized protein n=1 Tax=Gluconacetobacter diazotrophicus (strain ATCC 49037 / DSM 5601 / CCUG 37298 / CIP 103539 / LMG 7603 / PAl5) TaxID=272568 RepID=A9HSC9_GLUDA|nr:hypothetical protein GDI3117 [Gluconacetobacter diazotrophicus PA1 5]